jgi:hypothetical protein
MLKQLKRKLKIYFSERYLCLHGNMKAKAKFPKFFFVFFPKENCNFRSETFFPLKTYRHLLVLRINVERKVNGKNGKKW